MDITVNNNVMTIKIPVNQEPPLSSSGKTRLVASDRTKVDLGGYETTVQVNAHFKAEQSEAA